MAAIAEGAATSATSAVGDATYNCANFIRADVTKLDQGQKVYYWSTSGETYIETQFLRASSSEPGIVRLEHQRHAPAAQVYILSPNSDGSSAALSAVGDKDK